MTPWNFETSIEYMKGSKSVADWNNRREYVKALCVTESEQAIIGYIDSSGLIVQVLGMDHLDAKGVALRA